MNSDRVRGRNDLDGDGVDASGLAERDVEHQVDFHLAWEFQGAGVGADNLDDFEGTERLVGALLSGAGGPDRSRETDEVVHLGVRSWGT